VEERYRNQLSARSFGPGWAKPEPSLWPEPRRDHLPAHWRAADARDALVEAATFVSTEDAERRNLICINPMPGNTYESTRTLVAAYQLVCPGEQARSHRHSPNALRFIVDAEPGAYTVVEGTRVDLAPGDVVLTPARRWHGHGNDSSANALWIDFLDVPLVQHLGPMFFEPHPDGCEAITSSDPSSPLRVPVADAVDRTVEEVSQVEIAAGQLSTIGLHVIGVPAAATTDVPRTTANFIYALAGGDMTIAVEDAEPFAMEPGDVVAVPAWNRHRISSTTGGSLLRVSDLPMLEALGLLRFAAAHENDH
jgi:gentisate 1,2-dioxygenase